MGETDLFVENLVMRLGRKIGMENELVDLL